MKRSAVLAFLLTLVIPTSGWAAPADTGQEETVPFESVKIFVEFNSTDRDIGIQLFIDAEAWKYVTVFDPNGLKVLGINARGHLRPLGGSELSLEGDEPGLDELSIEDLLAKFPSGTYTFVGTSPDGEMLMSTAKFSHRIPDGPTLTTADTLDPAHAVVSWEPVTTPAGVNIGGYEVVIEKDKFHVFDVKVPASVTRVTIPPQFLQPGTEYDFEVLAIDKNNNQTITSSSFETE